MRPLGWGKGRGRAGEQDDDLPLRVHSLVVVVASLRRGDPEAGEQERRRHLRPGRDEVGHGYIVSVRRECSTSRSSDENQAASLDGAGVAKRDGLEVPAGPGGVQAELGEALGDVVRG